MQNNINWQFCWIWFIMQLRSWNSCSSSILVENWNLNFEMLVFHEGGKPECPEKNPRSKVRTNNKLNPHKALGQNPGHIGGRQAFLTLCHPCSPSKSKLGKINYISMHILVAVQVKSNLWWFRASCPPPVLGFKYSSWFPHPYYIDLVPCCSVQPMVTVQSPWSVSANNTAICLLLGPCSMVLGPYSPWSTVTGPESTILVQSIPC